MINNICDDEFHQTILKSEALRALTTMRIVNCMKCWYLSVAAYTITIIEVTFNRHSWNDIWSKIRFHFGTVKPHCLKKLVKSRRSSIQFWILT